MRLISIAKLVSLIGLIALSACSKKPDTQTVRISFPDWAQLQKANYDYQSRNSTPIASKAGDVSSMSGTFADVQIISINVSGSGVTNKVPFHWARNDGAAGDAPSEVSLTVPKGALVQALALLDANGSSQFYYGDATVGDADTQDLSMTLTNVAAAQQLTEGRLIGRYYAADGSNPTGVFEYRYSPPSRPSMVVEKAEMFSGWVRAFALSSNLVQYGWQKDGSTAFEFTSLDNSFLAPSAGYPARVARIHQPAGYELDNSSQTATVRAVAAKDYTVGYFGPGADAAVVAARAGGGDLRVCFAYVSTTSGAPVINGLYADSAITTPMQFISKLATDSGAAHQVGVVDPDGSATTYVRGGQTACSGGTELVGNLTLDHAQMRNDDNVFGFRGPFAKLATGTYLNVGIGTTTLTATWAYAPGAASALAGVSIFSRLVSSSSTAADKEVKTNDGLRCADFRDSSKFSPAFTETQVASPTTSQTISLSSAIPAGFVPQVIVCPRAADGSLYMSAIRTENVGNTSNIGAPQALQFFAADATVPTAAAPKGAPSGLCYPISLRSVDSAGNVSPLQTPVSVTVTRDARHQIFTDSACTTLAATSYNVVGFSGESRFYVKTSATASDGAAFSFAATATGLTGATYYGVERATAVADTIKTTVPSTLWAQSCTGILFTAVGPNGLADPGNGAVFNLYSDPTNLEYFADTDMTCQTPLGSTSFSFPTGRNTVFMRIRYKGPATAGTVFNLKPTIASGFAGTVADANTTLQTPGVATGLRINAFSAAPAFACTPVYVELVDAQGHTVLNNSGAAVTFTTTTDLAGAFRNSSCTSVGSSSIANGSSTSTAFAYFPQASGTHHLGLSAIVPSGLVGLARDLTVAPSTPTSFFIAPPGITYDTTNHYGSGTALNQLSNQPVQLTIYALTADGRLANGTQGASSYTENLTFSVSAGGYTFTGATTSTTVTFNSGVATVVLYVPSTYRGAVVSPVFNVSQSSVAPVLAQTATVSNGIPVVYEMTSPTHLQIYGSLINAVGACQPILATFEDALGVSRVLNSSVNFTFNVYDGSSGIVPGAWGIGGGASSCSSGSNPLSSTAAAGSRYVLAYTQTTGVLTGGNLLPSSSLPGAGNSLPSYAVTASPSTASQLNFYGSASPAVGSCTPYLLAINDLNQISVPYGAALSVTLGTAAGATGNFYTDDACVTASVGNVTIPQSDHAVVIFYQPLTAASGALTARGSAMSATTYQFAITPQN